MTICLQSSLYMEIYCQLFHQAPKHCSMGWMDFKKCSSYMQKFVLKIFGKNSTESRDDHWALYSARTVFTSLCWSNHPCISYANIPSCTMSLTYQIIHRQGNCLIFYLKTSFGDCTKSGGKHWPISSKISQLLRKYPSHQKIILKSFPAFVCSI